MSFLEMQNEIVGRKIATDFPAAKQKQFHTHITRIFFVAEKRTISSTKIVPYFITTIKKAILLKLTCFSSSPVRINPFDSSFNSGFKRDVFIGAVHSTVRSLVINTFGLFGDV